MITKELQYFNINGDIGWNQNRFIDPVMRIGGCAAVTACDLCICLAKYHGFGELYPGDPDNVSKKDYIRFSKIMKSYLHPRMQGIDTTDLYLSGFNQYLKDVGVETICGKGFSGEKSPEAAVNEIISIAEKDIPVPYLLLKHRKKHFHDFEWHWFNLVGYSIDDNRFRVKAVSYGRYFWFDFDDLWDTGYERKGGFIKLLATARAKESR